LNYQRVPKTGLPKEVQKLPSDPDKELLVESDVDHEGRVVHWTFLLNQGELKTRPGATKKYFHYV
jgi:hypothetical protein